MINMGNLPSVAFAVAIPVRSRSKIGWIGRLHTKQTTKFICVTNFCLLWGHISYAWVFFLRYCLKRNIVLVFPTIKSIIRSFEFFDNDLFSNLFGFCFQDWCLSGLLVTVRNHLKMRWSKCENVPSFDLLPCIFIDSNNVLNFWYKFVVGFWERHIS